MDLKKLIFSDVSVEAKVSALAIILDKELPKLTEKVDTVKKLQGQRGERGVQGNTGKPGIQGKDGSDGKDSRDGKDGKKGSDGADGISVTNAKIDFDDSLVFTLSNGKTLNVGEIKGEKGQKGERGAAGLSGSAGGVTTFSAGSSGLTPNTATAGAVTLAGTLNVANGGTGVTTSTGSGNVVLSTSPTLVTPALGTPSALVGTNITGTAAGFTVGSATSATALAVGRTIAITGDVSYTSPSFDGSANVTAVGTLATVATPGATGGSTAIPVVTINAKGLTTSVTTVAVVAPAGTLSGSSLAAGVTASSLTSLGTIANLTATAGTVANTPTAATDIANKLYVDTVAQGLDAKASCVVATTADITLSGTQTIDGIAVIAGNRVLVKNQTLSQNNGIYLCAAGAWTRTTDANTFDALVSAFTFVETGTVNSDIGFVCTVNAGGTLGTTPLPFSQFSSAGSFTAGTGLTLTGSVFSLTSPVAVTNGGTNSAASPTAGGISFGTGTAYGFTATGTAGQVLVSSGAGTPVFAGVSGGIF